jgi:hypothetical protein
MTTTLPEQVERQILARLKNGDERNDIILALCEAHNLGWKEAEELVDSVHAENAEGITLYQSPLLVLLALGIFLGGAGLIAYSLFHAVSVYEAIRSAGNETPGIGGIVGQFMYFLVITSTEYFGMLILGAGMIVGSLRGMQDIWSALFARLKIF